MASTGAIPMGNRKLFLFPILARKHSFEKVKIMFYRECEVCGCSLDPGEGRICEDCASEEEQTQRNAKELERMIKSTDYVQMEMEEFFKWQ